MENKKNDKVPVPHKLAYSVGLSADQYASQSLIHMAMPVYNVLLGVNPSLIAFILGFLRFWDAITDPIIGKASDNFRSSQGRRKPLIKWGAICTGLSFPLIWLVPENWPESYKAIYFTLILMIYYCCYSVYSVSYSSLGMEMTPCYKERTKLFAFRNAFSTPLTLGIPWIVAVAYSSTFSTPLEGMQVVGVIIGGIIILGGLFASSLANEKYHSITKSQEKVKVFASFRELKKNKSVLSVVLLMFICLFSNTLISSLGFYINSYYVFLGDIKAAATLSALIGTVCIFVTIMTSVSLYRFAQRFSKEKIIYLSIIIDFSGNISKFWTFSPEYPEAMAISIITTTVASAMFWVVIISMKADVCDSDEYSSGVRREGMISSLVNWSNKTAMACGLILSGVVITICGFAPEEGSSPTSESLSLMLMMFVFIPCIFNIASLFLLKNYSLTNKTHFQIRTKLEQIRGAV